MNVQDHSIVSTPLINSFTAITPAILGTTAVNTPSPSSLSSRPLSSSHELHHQHSSTASTPISTTNVTSA
ncbi:unnamed protein product, partial [Rotaria magnacalcarata]